MISQIDVSGLTFLPGCSAMLDEKTALLDLQWTGNLDAQTDWQERWARHLADLRPGDPLWSFAAPGFPADFLAPGSLTDAPPFVVWVVALTVALQRWARQPVWQGAVIACSGNASRLALPYQREDVFKAAFEMALRLLLKWSQTATPNKRTKELADTMHAWLQTVQRQGWMPNTLRFFGAARQRGIPTANRLGMLQLGQGCYMELLDGSFTGHTSGLAGRVSKSKQLTSYVLGRAAIPVPAQQMVATLEAAQTAANALGWPVVIKPVNQDQGRGVMPGIRTVDALRQAFAAAEAYSPGQVIVEKHINGHDYRLLVVGGMLRVATLRVPGGVTGDGVHSVQKLLDVLNAHPLRGTDKDSMLIHIELDAQAQDCLADQLLTPASVPTAGQFVRLRRTANVSTGGTAHDATIHIHADNRALAERATRLVGLDIAGVDFLCPDISRSWREVGGAICEVNGQPALRPHWLAVPGHDINGEIVDWLYRDKPNRIPTAAITGGQGKTTVARLLHHIWLSAGKTAGLCTQHGVWVGDEVVSNENLSGYHGARILLEDPAVEVAVMEMPHQALRLCGHPCELYDVAAMLSVQASVPEGDSMATLEQIARLHAQALQRARVAVVVTADDPLCLAMRSRAPHGVLHVLIAHDGHNPAVVAHRNAGGQALFVARVQSEAWVVHAQGIAQSPLMRLASMATSGDELLPFDETSALFAMALAGAQGLPWDTVCKAMMGTMPLPAINPCT